VAAFGSTVIRRPDGSEYDIGGSWQSMTVHEAISRALGEEITVDTPDTELRVLCDKADVPLQPSWNVGQVVLEMYERLAEKQTVEPTFYRDFRSRCRRSPAAPHRAAAGGTLGPGGVRRGARTGYSELVDPVVQRERLTAQSLLAAGGDPEAMQLDEDFLRALEYAMPPHRRHGHGHRPPDDHADRGEHPGDLPVPVRPPRF